MSHVFLVGRPEMLTYPGASRRARLLLKAGKAAAFKRFPFTLILRQPGAQAAHEPLRLKIDPGSHTTGLALVGERSGKVLWAGELTHQGAAIVERLQKRRADARRGRRQRHTQVREARFANRRRPEGLFRPSRGAACKTW